MPNQQTRLARLEGAAPVEPEWDLEGVVHALQWAERAWRTLSADDRAAVVKHHDRASLSIDEQATIERLQASVPADVFDLWGQQIDAATKRCAWHRDRWPGLST